MIIVESLVDKTQGKRKIHLGDKGKADEFDMKQVNFPVWFYKHENEFYWFPLWMNINEIKILKENKQ